MPDVKRKSTFVPKETRLFRLYDKTMKQWYCKQTTYSWPLWTNNEHEGRLYKRKSDLVNSAQYAEIELSEDRYEIVEYRLQATGDREGLVVEETYYERLRRERGDFQPKPKVPLF
jgi:hypothetical protein